MSLEVGAVVWAKTAAQPWWPAKIMHHRRHHGARIFKVAFFNHSSYAHLHQHHLSPYQPCLPPPHPASSHQHTHALQKAIALADCATSPTPTPTPPPSPQQPVEPAEPMIGEEELGVDNVIETIEAYRSARAGREGQSYCYHSRKQQIGYRDLLRDTLLRKYNLALPQAKFQNITVRAPQQTPALPKLKRIRKQHSRSHQHCDQEQLRRKCLRRVHALLKANSTPCPQQSAFELMRRIQGVAEDCPHKMHSLVVGLVRSLASGELGEYRGWLERTESQKNDDEEGSKMTQYSLPQCPS